MDVKIKCDEGNFKMRVSGLIIKNGKLLTVDICENNFYCLPGGHVHLGESSLEAIKREIKEEVGVEAIDVKLLSIIENFFTNNKGKVVHEVCYYYTIYVEGVNENDYTFVENDEGELKELKFKWFKLAELENIDFRPKALAKKLKSGNFDFEHIITKD